MLWRRGGGAAGESSACTSVEKVAIEDEMDSTQRRLGVLRAAGVLQSSPWDGLDDMWTVELGIESGEVPTAPTTTYKARPEDNATFLRLLSYQLCEDEEVGEALAMGPPTGPPDVEKVAHPWLVNPDSAGKGGMTEAVREGSKGGSTGDGDGGGGDGDGGGGGGSAIVSAGGGSMGGDASASLPPTQGGKRKYQGPPRDENEEENEEEGAGDTTEEAGARRRRHINDMAMDEFDNDGFDTDDEDDEDDEDDSSDEEDQPYVRGLAELLVACEVVGLTEAEWARVDSFIRGVNIHEADLDEQDHAAVALCAALDVLDALDRNVEAKAGEKKKEKKEEDTTTCTNGIFEQLGAVAARRCVDRLRIARGAAAATAAAKKAVQDAEEAEEVEESAVAGAVDVFDEMGEKEGEGVGEKKANHMVVKAGDIVIDGGDDNADADDDGDDDDDDDDDDDEDGDLWDFIRPLDSAPGAAVEDRGAPTAAAASTDTGSRRRARCLARAVLRNRGAALEIGTDAVEDIDRDALTAGETEEWDMATRLRHIERQIVQTAQALVAPACPYM